MDWRVQLGIAFLLVIVTVAGTWYGVDSWWRVTLAETPSVRDTVRITEWVNVPPPVVTPNPAPARPRPDLTQSKTIDSLISVTANKDSLIRELSITQSFSQNYSTSDPTGLTVSGLLLVIYSPVERHFLTHMVLDSIRVPVTTVTVTQTIIEDRLAGEWLVAVGAVGIVVGVLIAK